MASSSSSPEAGESESPKQVEEEVVVPQPEVTPFRWIILTLLILHTTTNAQGRNQLGTMDASHFYGVSEQVMDLVSMTPVTFLPLILPALYILHRYGLRAVVLLSSFGTVFGCWVKVFSTSPDRFTVLVAGQGIVTISGVLLPCLPPLVAATWFGPSQVAKATAFGIVGGQVGEILGSTLWNLYFIKTKKVQIVRDYYDELQDPSPHPPPQTTEAAMESDIQVMFLATGAATVVLFIAIIFLFRDKSPPNSEKGPYCASLKALVTNKGYVLLLLSYGLNLGVFYAVSTVLSSFVLKYHPGHEEDTRSIMLMMVLLGMLGSLVGGFFLDKTRRFKEIALFIHFLSFVGMVLYTFTLPLGNSLIGIDFLYVVFAILGFFMSGFLPILGFEFAAEFTYPQSVGTSAGLLVASAQVFGIILTSSTRILFEGSWGDKGANLLLCGILLLTLLMTATIKADLRRTAAQQQQQTPIIIRDPQVDKEEDN